MKYSKAIMSFFILGFSIIILLFYLANITRIIEKENYVLKEKINIMKEQININEIEYSVYSSYEYLTKMQKVYFQKKNRTDFNNRISFSDLLDKELEDFLHVGIK